MRNLMKPALGAITALAALTLAATPAVADPSEPEPEPVEVAECMSAQDHAPVPEPVNACARASHPDRNTPAAMPSADACALVKSVDACAGSTVGGYVQEVVGVCAGALGDYRRVCVNGPDGCGAYLVGVRLLPSGDCNADQG